MLTGLTGALLGASKATKSAYAAMIASPSTEPGSINKPLSWTDPSFSLVPYDLVFLPGGHEKGVRQLIDSEQMHRQLAEYFPLTKRDAAEGASPKRTVAAICHGVQVLAFTPHPSTPNKSIIASCTTTALPASLEQGAFHATRLFLGDYYKTYGRNSKSVQGFVKAGLHDATQFKNSPHLNPKKPWIVEDQGYRYVSGRFPPDAEMLAKRAVELVWEARGGP
jgi:putative intracellular protease/amidase